MQSKNQRRKSYKIKSELKATATAQAEKKPQTAPPLRAGKKHRFAGFGG